MFPPNFQNAAYVNDTAKYLEAAASKTLYLCPHCNRAIDISDKIIGTGIADDENYICPECGQVLEDEDRITMADYILDAFSLSPIKNNGELLGANLRISVSFPSLVIDTYNRDIVYKPSKLEGPFRTSFSKFASDKLFACAKEFFNKFGEESLQIRKNPDVIAFAENNDYLFEKSI